MGFIDNIAGAGETSFIAWVKFLVTFLTLTALGLEVALDKLVLPTQNMVWLGVTFDTHNKFMSILPEKLKGIVQVSLQMSKQKSVPLKELQSLLGKFMHATYILPQLKVVACRMIDALKGSPAMVTITKQLRDDLVWIVSNESFLKTRAQLSERKVNVDKIVVSGGRLAFTVSFKGKQVKVSERHAQGLSFIPVLKSLCQEFSTFVADSTLQIINRSDVFLSVINTGRAQSDELLYEVRKLWSVLVKYNIVLQVI